MITREQGLTVIDDVNVFDVMLVSQLIEKLLINGLISGRELTHVAVLRNKLFAKVKSTIDVDLDQGTSN